MALEPIPHTQHTQALALGARTTPLASEGMTGLSAVGPMVQDGIGGWLLSPAFTRD